MSWFDQVAQAGYQAKASLKTAGNHIPEWWNGLKEQYSSWKQEQQAQHEQLKQQREEASARISSLKDPNQFRNMNHEQRAAQIHEVAGEMPDRMAVAHAHPFVNALTTPFRIGWSTLRAVAGKTTAISPHITPSSNTMFLFFAILYHVAIIFTFDPTLKSRIWRKVGMFVHEDVLVWDFA